MIKFLTAITPEVARVSAFSPLEDRNTAYAHIRKEIEGLEAAIRALKRHHNNLSSISKLPAEVLTRIFELLAFSKDNAAEPKPHWIGISHVCSQWRHIALECPTLWNHIQCSHHLRWVIEMLKRSKWPPITAEGRTSCGAPAVDGAIIATLEQLPRIEHLTLTLRGWPKLKKIMSSLSGAAPLLHTFHITLDDSQAMLPDTIFSGPGGAPQLRCLLLDGCTVNWTSKFLHSLTHFTLIKAPTGCRLSVNELITNLGNMPQLESIHLSSVMVQPGDSELNASSSPSTLLPFIARIHLEDNLMNCLAFFAKVTYPNTAIVSVMCFLLTSYTNVVTHIRDFITVINVKNIVPITSLYVSHGTFLGQDSQGIRRVFVGFQGIPCLRISWDALPLHHLKFLCVSGIKILRSEWLSVFGKLNKLKIIRITDHANEFLDVLSRRIPRDLGPGLSHATETSSPGKLKFKALKSLSLRSTLGNHYGEHPWPEKLALCFRERRRRGLTLRRLSIEGYGGGTDVVCRLGSFIKHVEWTEVYEETSVQDYGSFDEYMAQEEEDLSFDPHYW